MTTNSETVYWKSLEELRLECRTSPGHAGAVSRDPSPSPLVPAADVADRIHRRDFLTLMGFTLAATSCSRAPVREAIPFLTQPEDVQPGVAAWYATTCGGCSASCSMLVKTRDGRPIKVEGNPESPLFGGGTCAVGQATVLSLYDDDRLRGPLWQGTPASWDDVDAHIDGQLRRAAADRGRVVLLTNTITGPATRDLIGRWSRRYPGFQHVVYEPVSFTAMRRAYDQCVGRAIVPHHRLDRARLVVGLEADFLGTWLSPVEFTRQYAGRRRPGAGMMRHVHFESGLSLTGANADTRHAVAPGDIGVIAVALLALVRSPAGGSLQFTDTELPVPLAILNDLASELRRHPGECVVVCGLADVETQLVVAALNQELGAIGASIDIDRPSLQKQADDREMASLVADMRNGGVRTLMIHGVNPVYDYADAALFLEGLKKVELVVSFAGHLDETASHAHAVCPDHHFLEAWGDAEPVASSYGLAQPTIAPLFETRALQDSLLKWLGEGPDFHAYLRDYWRAHLFPRQEQERDFDRFWDTALQAGFLELASGTRRVSAFAGDVEGAAKAIMSRHTQDESSSSDRLFALHLYEPVALRDGRHANNPWLQELPDPITKITWGHSAAIAPAVAQQLGLTDGDIVSVRTRAASLQLPVSVQPGQSPTTVSIALGYGRERAGRVGQNVGVNAFRLMPIEADGVRRTFTGVVEIERTGRRAPLATTQTHHSMEGRPLVREITLASFLDDRTADTPHGGDLAHSGDPSLWPEHPAPTHRWGLAIDLGACTGCSACVVACQAENNVPVVGADEVRRGREMHWIRIDRYYGGGADAPDTVFQPVMCQHCANAPCETVCPVLATVHSSDGINQQIYNRCIGTRYCENNCPYKVRRFNWFTYAQSSRFDFNMANPVETMVLNPDVVVRSRGVMEKCSLCIQRIQAGQLAAKRDGRLLEDGEIRTACQQVCPAEAIVFGDLQDPDSRIAGLARSSRHYHLLESVGTRPNVGYLTKVRNRET